jgi:hypothetical protein
MAVRKATGKAHNKKLRRRRDGLSTKCFEYGELDGAELALFIRYPKRGEFYAYVSRRGLPWLQDVSTLVSQTTCAALPLPLLNADRCHIPRPEWSIPRT